MFEIKQTTSCPDNLAYYFAQMRRVGKNSKRHFSEIIVGGIMVFAGIFGFYGLSVSILQYGTGLKDIFTVLFALVMSFCFLDIGIYLALRIEIVTFIATLLGTLPWHKAKGEESELRFDPDTFTLRSPFGIFQFPYSSVFQIVEDKTHYFIFTATGPNCMIRKDSFVQGDPEQFRDFIQGKTEVKIKGGK